VDQESETPVTQSVTLEPIVNYCAGGDCPTIFRTDRNTLVIQGYEFEPRTAGAKVPAGERMIEVPVDLLAEYARMTN